MPFVCSQYSRTATCQSFDRPCIIPASGYYEWQDTPGGKQPHYFTRTDGQVISFAGLWDEWKERDRRDVEVLHDDHYGTECHGRGSSRSHAGAARAEPVHVVAGERGRPGDFGACGRRRASGMAVSKRVNSSKVPKDDETLTQAVDLDAPQLQMTE
jgi:SOS response associated peptidase (SRAP)